MEQFKLFIQLTRLKKPTGYMLLFWPCSWGLTIAYDFSEEITTYFFYLFLFFSGSILMRSAGCIVNDIVDRNYDKKVFRTKNRPIASKKIDVLLGIFYGIILCLLALIVLLQFNKSTIIFALFSMPLAFIYPFMKRLTYWPQLFLGITFNYGLLLGWISIYDELNILPIIFYFGSIFWTLGYDTIYGFQDIKDDEIIGLKSTSIKFKKFPKQFIFFSYCIFIFSLIIVGVISKFSFIYFIFLLLPVIHLIFYQIYFFKKNNPSVCLKVFKANNLLGLIILLNLLIGKTL
jgi:4-hydroxybenzoate polyprenyltransferase